MDHGWPIISTSGAARLVQRLREQREPVDGSPERVAGKVPEIHAEDIVPLKAGFLQAAERHLGAVFQ